MRPHRRQPTRLCHPWDSPGKNTGVGCHCLLHCVKWEVKIVWKWKVKVKSLSRVRLIGTPWTAAYQAPPSMGFSRQEYWSGLPYPAGVEIGSRMMTQTGFSDIVWTKEVQEMASHCSILTWRVPWTEEPGSCSPQDRSVRDHWSDSTRTYTQRRTVGSLPGLLRVLLDELKLHGLFVFQRLWWTNKLILSLFCGILSCWIVCSSCH